MVIDNIGAPSFIGGEFKKPRSGGYRNATCGDWNVGKMNREEELKKEGWEKRFTIDEPRLSEMVEQYKELGFEVLLEPVDTSSEECTTCITASHDRYKTIYTRQRR